jgi:hypothetical protein
MLQRLSRCVFGILLLPACEYIVVDGSLGVGAAPASSGQGGAGGKAEGGATGWPECSTPSGYIICGGDFECPLDSAECVYCLDRRLAQTGGVSICVNSAPDFTQCYRCPDGELCVQYTQLRKFLYCAPGEVGLLFGAAGAPEQVRYADYGMFTGDPLPEPTTCPAVSGFTLCGGACGGCPAGSVCTGRSPLHPYSLCVPEIPGCGVARACSGGDGCFVFRVEPEAQPLADELGYCLPLSECMAAAENLPGGGFCVAP